MHRARLRSRERGREETLPELAQAIRWLTQLAYPDAPTSLRETLARDFILDALPESDARSRIHQTKLKTLREALRQQWNWKLSMRLTDSGHGGAIAVLPPRKDQSKGEETTEGLNKECSELKY